MIVKRKKFIILIAVFVFLFAIFFISIGCYFERLSKSSSIVGNIIDHVQEKSWHYLFPSKDIFVGNQFTMESVLDFDLDSDYYKNQSLVDTEALRKYHILQNINNLDTKIMMKHDAKNRKLLLDFHQKLGIEELYHRKEYVENETGYYYVDGILNQYVNNGTCHYFETIRDNHSIRDNLLYINKYFFKALKNSMIEENYETYEVKTNVHGQERNVHQVSFRLTDKLIKTIWNSSIEEYEKDKEASFLISNIFPNYKDYLLKEEDSILSNDEYYIINIYTTNFLYIPIKYEVIHMMGDEKEVFIYEGDESSGDGYYLLNDKVEYVFQMKWKEKSIHVKIKNQKGEDLGDFRFDRDGNTITANYSFEEKDRKYDVIYSSKYEKEKKSKSLKNTQYLSFKYIENKVTHLSGAIAFVQKFDNKVFIDEELGDVILASKLTDEQKLLFDNKRNSIKERMEK